jgi:hypothetical protein
MLQADDNKTVKMARSSGLKLSSYKIIFFKALVFPKTDIKNAKKRAIFG